MPPPDTPPNTIRLSDHFSLQRLLRFTFPSIAMMLFTSLYGVVDGFFVANFAGATALAALTLVLPLLMIMGALGFMVGTGGAAIVGKLLGEGKRLSANRCFTLLVLATGLVGLLFSLVGQFFIQPLTAFLGAEGAILHEGVLYARIALFSLPCFMLQFFFQCLFVTAEKPRIGLFVTLAAGTANMLLDALFVWLCGWGLVGAALATSLGEGLGGLFPLFYFARKNTSLLRFVRPRWQAGILFQACFNGASEFLGNIAFSFLISLYNVQLLRFAGEKGVAAFGVLLYISYIFSTVFGGYALGVSPLLSYNFGANNRAELKNIFCKSQMLALSAGLIMALFVWNAAEPMARLFTGNDAELLAMTTHAVRLFSPVLFFSSLTILGPALFTALNNGLLSGALAVCRMVLFGAVNVLFLPLFLALEGIWWAWPLAEMEAFVLSLLALIWMRKRYGYA